MWTLLSWKFRKFLVWRSQSQNGCFSGFLCTSYRKKFYCKPVVLMESVHSESMAFGSQPTRYQELQMGNTKSVNSFGFQKFIFSISSKIYKNSQNSVVVILKIWMKVAEILPENWFWGYKLKKNGFGKWIHWQNASDGHKAKDNRATDKRPIPVGQKANTTQLQGLRNVANPEEYENAWLGLWGSWRLCSWLQPTS